jgi:hypothetical protein
MLLAFSRESGETDDKLDLQFDSFVNNAMGGFIIVFSSEGDVIYVSESIANHLGLAQVNKPQFNGFICCNN